MAGSLPQDGLGGLTLERRNDFVTLSGRKKYIKEIKAVILQPYKH